MIQFFRTKLHSDEGEPRTLGNLKTSNIQFQEAGAIHKDAKKFNNVINKTVFDGDDSTEILDILPPPELHLLLGVTLSLCTGTFWFLKSRHK